jgi:hypothetical protein
MQTIQSPLSARARAPSDRRSRRGRMLRFLCDADRDLALMCARRRSFADIGRQIGVCAGSVSRRWRKLRTRMSCPFLKAVACELHRLDEQYRALAIDYYFRDVSLGAMARQSGRSKYRIERDLQYIKGWARALYHQRLLRRARRRQYRKDPLD